MVGFATIYNNLYNDLMNKEQPNRIQMTGHADPDSGSTRI